MSRNNHHQLLRPITGRPHLRWSRRSLVAVTFASAVVGIGANAVSNADAATTNVWSSAGTLATARTLATATLLQNGQVLVVGGTTGSLSGGSPAGTAELYNPATNTWTATSGGAPSVSNPVSVLLSNGDVLVAGGTKGNVTNGTATSAAEIYNPTTNTWSATTNNMPTGVFAASIATLADNDVVVIGGYTSTVGSPAATNAVSIYRPSTNSWVQGNNLPSQDASADASVTVLANGNVLYAGGESAPGSPLNTAALYSSAQGTWSSAGTFTTARSHAGAALEQNGQVLLVGGEDASQTPINSSVLYDPATNTWTATGSLLTARANDVVSPLPTGQVIAAGGINALGNEVTSAELYNPSTSSWTTTGSLTSARSNAADALLPGGTLLVVGGQLGGVALNSAESYFSGAPVAFVGPTTAAVVTGATTNIAIVANGSPAPTISEVGALPRGLTFSVGANGTAAITGTAVGPTASLRINLTATNSLGYATESMTINVTQPAAPGYLLTTKSAIVSAFGQAVNSLQGTSRPSSRRIVAIGKSPGTTGYYLISAAGNVYNEGGAPFFGSTASTKLASPISAFAATADGAGYWLVTKGGTVYAFGDAVNDGSVNVSATQRPIVAISPSANANGYYLVTQRGNVYNKGGAKFYGSLAAAHLPHPIVTFGVDPAGTGYWLISSGGNVWNYGSASWRGSKAKTTLASPIVAFASSLDGKGYYLVSANGTVYNYADATKYGSPAVAKGTTITGMVIPD